MIDASSIWKLPAGVWANTQGESIVTHNRKTGKFRKSRFLKIDTVTPLLIENVDRIELSKS